MPQRSAAIGVTAVPQLLVELFLGVVTVVHGLDRGLVGRDVHDEDDGAWSRRTCSDDDDDVWQ